MLKDTLINHENKLEIIDFGISNYDDILNYQKTVFDRVLNEKKLSGKTPLGYLLLGEHFPVITCGRRAKSENILLSNSTLEENNIQVYKIERGGDVTYHCPGQLIVYPILDLEYYRLGVKKYIELLEEAVIKLLEKYNIEGTRIEGATGVWLGKGTDRERKICAIGVKCSRFCTMHGLALNVNSDLSGFSMINPCGFKDKGVTSMQLELEKKLDINKIKEEFSDIFLRLIFPL